MNQLAIPNACNTFCLVLPNDKLYWKYAKGRYDAVDLWNIPNNKNIKSHIA